MNKCCENCNREVTPQAVIAFFFFRPFVCSNCKTKLVIDYDKKVSVFFNIINFCIGIFLGYYQWQNVPIFITTIFMLITFNVVWFYDCQIRRMNELYDFDWLKKIWSSVKKPSLAEIIILLCVLIIAAAKFRDQTRSPSSLPNGNDQFLTRKIYNDDFPDLP